MQRKKCYIYMRVSTAMQVDEVQPGSPEGLADKIWGISEDGYCPGIL